MSTGWATDDWPAIVLDGPIWLADNSSVMRKVHERLYGGSHLLNDTGQYLYYGGGRVEERRGSSGVREHPVGLRCGCRYEFANPEYR